MTTPELDNLDTTDEETPSKEVLVFVALAASSAPAQDTAALRVKADALKWLSDKIEQGKTS